MSKTLAVETSPCVSRLGEKRQPSVGKAHTVMLSLSKHLYAYRAYIQCDKTIVLLAVAKPRSHTAIQGAKRVVRKWNEVEWESKNLYAYRA